MSTIFFQPTFKGNFVAGASKYIATTFNHPPPDVYWNPRTGQWLTYAAQKWRFIDENLPGLGQLDPVLQAEKVFDTITQQWAALATPQHNSAVWDGRQHKWIVAENLGGDGDSREDARREYERKLAILNQDHKANPPKMTDEVYKKAAYELWREYEDRM